jgi:hypothetical protein
MAEGWNHLTIQATPLEDHQTGVSWNLSELCIPLGHVIETSLVLCSLHTPVTFLPSVPIYVLVLEISTLSHSFHVAY